MSQFPLPDHAKTETLMPSLYDISNQKIPNESCYSRQLKIASMNERGNPQQSPELTAAVQSQCKPMPVTMTLEQNPHPQIMNPVPGPKA